MTTEAQTGDEGSKSNGEGQKDQPNDLQAQLSKMQEQIANLEASKQRILDESQTWKNKFQEIKGKNDEEEKQRLLKEGKHEELLEKYKNEAHKWKSDFSELRKSVVDRTIDNEILKSASDAYDIKDLRNNFSPDVIKIGEDLNVSGIKDEIERLRKDKPYLFKASKTANQFTRKAPGIGDESEKGDDEAYRSELKAAKTQKEFEAVRRKYGRDENHIN